MKSNLEQLLPNIAKITIPTNWQPFAEVRNNRRGMMTKRGYCSSQIGDFR